MSRKWREPPGGYGRPSRSVAVATSFDNSRDNDSQPIPQDLPRRKLACRIRTIGPGERAAISALRRQRQIQKVHGLGPRALDELLIEIGTEFGITAIIEQKIEQYATLDPEAVRLVGGDRFPAQPIHEVQP